MVEIHYTHQLQLLKNKVQKKLANIRGLQTLSSSMIQSCTFLEANTKP
jgi:hypothetical protein